MNVSSILRDRVGGLNPVPHLRGAWGDVKNTRVQYKALKGAKARWLGHQDAKWTAQDKARQGWTPERLMPLHQQFKPQIKAARGAMHVAQGDRDYAKRQLRGIGGRMAVRATIGIAAISAAAFARKAYLKSKERANTKPKFRQYDVYPEHGFSAQGATQYNKPTYYGPQGGFEEPERSSSPVAGPGHIARSMSHRGQGVYESRVSPDTFSDA